MQTPLYFAQSHNRPSPKQITHVLVAGLLRSDKNKLIHHLSETPLEHVDLVRGVIPAKLPELLMGELQVDSRLTTKIWGAPDHWRHDYVNYLLNINTILNNHGNHHRVLGMIVVVDSLQTPSSAEESKLVRLIQAEWPLPYIIVISHPYAPHARPINDICEQYQINSNVPMLPCDVSQAAEAKRVLIELMYQTM